jgi:hypothetical protein
MIPDQTNWLGAYTQSPPAIVQPSRRSSQHYIHTYRAIHRKALADKRAILTEFKNSEAWKDTFLTWDETCTKGLHLSRRRVNELIAEVKPEDEHSFDGLAQPDEPQEVEVERQGPIVSGSPLTIEHLTLPDSQAKPATAPKPDPEPKEETTPEPPHDVIGRTIPQELLESWTEGRAVVQPLLTKLSALKSWIEQLSEEAGQGKHRQEFSSLYPSLQILREQIHVIYRALDRVKPDYLCPQCDGLNRSHCMVCEGSGFISSWSRDHDVIRGADPALADRTKSHEETFRQQHNER